nr:response regulator [Cytophagales bacterium]
EKMQEIDHLKSRFFANISHEFRTPLTLILGPLEKFISQTLPQNPDRALFQMMQRNGKKLLHLINQLLDLSKIESGDMKLVLKPTDLNTFLEGVLLSFASLAEKKKIRYRMMCPAEKLVAYVDSDKLEIILVNLLSNAFKFTPELGEIIVTVQTIPLETKPKAIPIQPTDIACTGRSLEIIVKDSGEGIAEDQLNKIFDRFYQVSPTLHGDKEGSGIGLSLVKELVALHQGEIRVENQLQQGCCFIVKLPIWIANVVELSIDHREVNTLIIENTLSDMDKMQPVGPPEADVDRRDSEYPIILVIEDNEDVRLFIRETLKSTYQVMEADNGEVGYQMATENVPDLILSDVMMPNMDGITLSRCLKANTNTAHVPLILLTAKASGEDKIAGLETGADDYLIKPFNASELLVRINNLIENRRKLRDHFSREITLQPASVAITSADEKFLNLAVAIIEANMADPTFGVDTFSREVGMSRTQLFRKLKALTNYPPGDFIRLMRLKKAAELLRVRAGNIGEVAFSVGFQDPSYFTKSFQKQFGKTPSDFLAANTSESKSAAPN